MHRNKRLARLARIRHFNVVVLGMAQAAGYRTPRYLTFKQAFVARHRAW
jgi:hypothetical protein